MIVIANGKEPKNKILENRILIGKNKLFSFIKERNDYIKSLPEIEKKAFITSIGKIVENKNKIERLLVKNEANKCIDDLLFSSKNYLFSGKNTGS